jgi:hypothetical protein
MGSLRVKNVSKKFSRFGSLSHFWPLKVMKGLKNIKSIPYTTRFFFSPSDQPGKKNCQNFGLSLGVSGWGGGDAAVSS